MNSLKCVLLSIEQLPSIGKYTLFKSRSLKTKEDLEFINMEQSNCNEISLKSNSIYQPLAQVLGPTMISMLNFPLYLNRMEKNQFQPRFFLSKDKQNQFRSDNINWLGISCVNHLKLHRIIIIWCGWPVYIANKQANSNHRARQREIEFQPMATHFTNGIPANQQTQR